MEWLKLYLPESISPLMEQMTEFHDHAMMILILIFSFLTILFLFLFLNYNLNLSLSSHEGTEITWTIFPLLILFTLALPSLQVLFLMEELVKPIISIKVIGNQWYWTYELTDFSNFQFDSYMKESKIFRLIEVDNSLLIPFLTQIRVMITSNDVIHSWTVPSLGLKIDANPGRLNSGWIYSFRSGYFYGQCSEICGVNHSFMPIKVEFVSLENFKKWILLHSNY